MNALPESWDYVTRFPTPASFERAVRAVVRDELASAIHDALLSHPDEDDKTQ